MSKINEQAMPMMADTSSRSRDGSAFIQSERAFFADLPITACPHPQNSWARIGWRDGFLKANRSQDPNFVEIPGTLKQGEKGIKYKYSAA